MRIAIIGGGISGLTTAWLLRHRHTIRLFEAGERLGGHTRTVAVAEGDRSIALDMGFIVFNERTYPLFSRLLGELGVASHESDMGFSVRCERTGLEYGGSSFAQLFAQRRNVLRWSFLRMLTDIVRFNRRARSLLDGGDEVSLAAYLVRERFSQAFIDWYLVPMAGAIWSTPPDAMGVFPVRMLATFLDNHGLLSVTDRPVWRVVSGGSARYVEALADALGDRVAVATPVERVEREEGFVEVTTEAGERERFDQVVFATHSDQALSLLARPTEAERSVLGAIPYRENQVVLHTDRRFLPRSRRAWSSWNAHLGTGSPDTVQLTYYLNLLQGIDSSETYCVTLNRTAEIDPDRIIAQQIMAHPVYTARSVEAQSAWRSISGQGFATHYCGAYWRFGFHEDGVMSALRVARDLGASW